MKVKMVFDFHDIFVNSKDAWLKAFLNCKNNQNIVMDYNMKMPKKDICKKYGLDYKMVEDKYRQYLEPIQDNIIFAEKLAKIYSIDLVSMSIEERLIKDLEKFNLEHIFDNIYSKKDVINREKFLENLSINYDWILFFNHEYEDIKILNKVVYMPINFRGELSQFDNISFTEHAKNKLLYNDLSKYYMEAIANNTYIETTFLKKVFSKYLNKDNGKILDCCCGVGRHDFLLAKDNFRIVGIDISTAQIENAKRFHNHKNIEYKVMDVRNIELEEKGFDMSMCMWTTYNYLSLDKDFKDFLFSNYKHLKKDGILVLDAKNIPSLEKRRVYKRNSYNDKFNMEMELIVNKFVDGNIQNSQYFYFINENGENRFLFDEEFVRFYYINEIKNIASGYFEIVDTYGDFDMSEYNENTSTRLIIILRKNS